MVLSDSETSAQQIKERLLSLLHEAAADRFEPAVNLLLGGSALYMGGLRLHTPLAAETKPPLEFIICNIDPPNVSSLQLGRIVYLVTLICTQRICALSDALSLHQVGRELSGLETARLLGGDPLTIIQKAHHDYTDTEKNFSKKTGSGPQYRIEQSRSYVAQLRANLKLLEIERLASDQPIGDLINQRSGSDFDFIDRLGKRLERATSKIASLDQTYLALNNIQLAANSNGIYDEIRKIQRIGDLALFLALLPYYLTHMLELFFPGGVISIVAVLFWTGVGSFGIFRLVCARLNLIIHGYVPFTRRWNFQHRGPRIALSTFATALALVAMTPKLLRSSEAWLPWSYAPRLDDRMGQSRPLDGTACGFVTAYGNADIRGTSALAHGRRTHGQHN